MNNIITGKFEFKKGNTLASFAEAMLNFLEMNTKDTHALVAPFDFITGKQQMQFGNEQRNFQGSNLDNQYVQLVLSVDKLVPFYRFYFTFYKINKRVLVLDLLQKVRVYDCTLFQLFVR